MSALLLKDRTLQYDRTHESQPRSGMIPVDVLLAGICETDLQLQQGYMNFAGVLGHEFVGIAQSGRFSGQRVVGEINCACGECSTCKRGRPRHCRHRSVIGILNHDGAFTQTVWVPEENLHAVADKLTNQQAVFTEPLAAACRIPEQLNIQSDDRILILGDGRLGNLCAQVLSTISSTVVVSGKHDWKLTRLADLGLTALHREDIGQHGKFDIVVDCTGSPSGFHDALKSVEPCGTIVLKTTVAESQSLHMAPIVIDEVNVIGSRCGPFAPALQLLEEGRINVDGLVTDTFALSDGISAFDRATQADALKVLLDVNG